MSPPLIEQLQTEKQRFQAWADATADEPRSGEWEDYYLGWGDIHRVFAAFLCEVPIEAWDHGTIELLLYFIARDSEDEFLVDELEEAPERLLFLARAALDCEERHARWQLASRLGDLRNHLSEAEPLLFRFAQDEYVRRRALMALGRLGSLRVEELVEDAWATGDVYQRMAVLAALRDARSPKLDHYLALAAADGREYLVASAENIEAGMAED